MLNVTCELQFKENSRIMALYHDVIPCTHVFVKEMLSMYIFGKQYKHLANILAIFLTIHILVLGVIILLPYSILIFIMKLGLMIWHGKEYGGILGRDSLFECTKSRITSVYIIEHSSSFEELYGMIEQSCLRLYQSHYRFSSRVDSFCGFYYFVKNSVCLRDVIFVEDCPNVLTKDQLIDYLEGNCFNDWNTTELWKVIIFNKPIVWNNDSKTYYPLLIRFNHCIGDGIALSVYLQKYFLSDVQDESFKKVMSKSQKSRDFLKTTNLGSILFIGPKLEYSKLNAVKSTPKLALFTEKEPKYLDIIKYLSKRLECSFTDVVTTAAITCVANYLKLEDVEAKNVIVYNTTRPIGNNPELLLQGEILENAFTFDAFNLPRIKGEDVLSWFNGIKHILKSGKESATGQIIYLVSNILSYIHPVLLTKFARYNSIGTTLGISNIPFADYGKIGSCPVKDAFFFVNHFEETKFVLLVISCKGKLEATLTTKENQKTSREELQLILENIFLNLDKLYEKMKLFDN